MKPQRSRTPRTKAAPLNDSSANSQPAPIQEIPHDEIARLAYAYWEQRGGEGGSAEEDWARAEQELRRQSATPPAISASAAG